MNKAALDQYKSVGLHSGMTDASPHRLIGMLLQGALDRIASAKGAISRNDIRDKGELISKAIAIIDNLRASLDHVQGGEISANLASLYDYIELRLVQANSASDITLLNEVSSLLVEIKSGWESIPGDQRRG